MKKLIFGITALLILSAPVYSMERSAMVKLGVAGGEIDTDTELGDEDLDTNLTVGLEYFFRFDNGFDIGVGAAFEKHELKSSKFNFGFSEIEAFPIYGLARYRFQNSSNWTPYIYGNLGYAIADEDRKELSVDGGLYMGAGVGVEYVENFGIEVGWARTEFDADFDGESFDPKSDLIKASLTMRLDH